ncbi:MAG: hypothetical protein ABSH38_04745 [Verrucomicrobiota bacterium]|jgi:hypothetical protein
MRTWGIKLIWLVLAGILLGCCYKEAVPRLYRPETKAGFWLGTVHGFLMPVALPNLLAGEDVPIFAANNTGRNYKLGYIAGINLCGLIFFGMAFRPKKEENPAPNGSSPQYIQPRKTSITSTRPPAQ